MIVSANNKVLPPEDYPYPFALDVMPGYRAERILERLREKSDWTAEQIAGIQTDVYIKQADLLLPVSVRPGGSMSRLLEQAGSAGKPILREFQVE